ncbi:MAG TPA: RHS repeat-associated core domain-containing protein [Verrucomicrobiae bacterium]|nr:RHS repeat-associated core domain-containing protein [Verrucomicrobiae bacterium]
MKTDGIKAATKSAAMFCRDSRIDLAWAVRKMNARYYNTRIRPLYGTALISQQQFDPNTLLPSVLSYYGYDGHGSVRFLMNTSGALTDTYTYDAFGNLIASTTATPNDYLYCGQQCDSDLGLYYNRARYLNPGIGRFWTMDGDYGNNEDPLSLHKYLYAEDDPVNMDDPSGHNGDLISLDITMDIGESLDSMEGVAVEGAQSEMEGTAMEAEATQLTEMGEAAGETAAEAEEEVAKTTLRQAGKTVRGLIEDAKKLLNKAKEDPIKVIPMPRAIIPKVADNITAAFLMGKPPELERCLPEQVALNREDAIGPYIATHGPAGLGKSLDEYPFASSVQGGIGARVTPVPEWQNWVQGGIISACYRIEGILPEETPYTVVVIP